MTKISSYSQTLPVDILSATQAPSYAKAMTRTVNISEAKANLSKLADDVSLGEEVIVSRSGKPVMKLVPLDGSESLSDSKVKMNRPLGAWAHFDPDFDFEAWDALDEDVRKLFKHLK